MEQLVNIAEFILDSFIHIWPYLLITIPIAVAVQVSGAAKYIHKAFSQKPMLSILLATIVGAFSPFCSCGVVPVIASLLIGGVPLAPVMAFWIASPSMDPEIFFLSTATLGWDLSVWRLAATFVISLFSGYFTHFAIVKGFIEKDFLRINGSTSRSFSGFNPVHLVSGIKSLIFPVSELKLQPVAAGIAPAPTTLNCCAPVNEDSCRVIGSTEGSNSCASKDHEKSISLYRLLRETKSSALMVIKFMFLAFFVNALITFYVPQEFISGILGGKGASTVLTAALIGIPAYTSNLTALPLVSGLLVLGMNPGAALAFLIAGPTTTLPAMLAVYGLVKRKVFLLYISFSLLGAIFSGLLYNVIN